MADRRKLITIRTDDDTYETLRTAANELGLSIGDMAEQLMAEKLEGMASDPLGAPIDLLIYAKDRKLAKQERRRASLIRMARHHLKYPTEQSAEELAEYCDKAGVVVEDILAAASETADVSVVETRSNIEIISGWLKQLMDQHGEIAQRDVMREAAAQGYKEYLVNEAKRQLGIRSTHKREGWVWHTDRKRLN